MSCQKKVVQASAASEKLKDSGFYCKWLSFSCAFRSNISFSTPFDRRRPHRPYQGRAVCEKAGACPQGSPPACPRQRCAPRRCPPWARRRSFSHRDIAPPRVYRNRIIPQQRFELGALALEQPQTCTSITIFSSRTSSPFGAAFFAFFFGEAFALTRCSSSWA